MDDQDVVAIFLMSSPPRSNTAATERIIWRKTWANPRGVAREEIGRTYMRKVQSAAIMGL